MARKRVYVLMQVLHPVAMSLHLLVIPVHEQLYKDHTIALKTQTLFHVYMYMNWKVHVHVHVFFCMMYYITKTKN